VKHDTGAERLRGWCAETLGIIDYGWFAWILDPDANKIELWEPRKQE